MLLNTTKEIGENLMGKNPPLKISRNTNFVKTCENVCYYAAAVSWFCVGEPMNPKKILMSIGVFLFGRIIMHSTE